VSQRPFKPGEIEIEKFEITNFTGLQESITDIRELCTEFSYYEDIYSPTISADFAIKDATGLLSDFPIVGDENISLSFHNKLNLDYIDIELRSYKVGDRVRLNERTVDFPLYCSSERAVSNPKSKVLSFNKGKISDYINNTFKGFVEVEPTQGEYRYIPTGETFFDTMNILSREAQSQNNLSSTYLFYETADGYHFVTLESLFARPTSRDYYFTLSNVERKSDKFGDDQIISKLEFLPSYDLISNMQRGLYGNRVIAIDPLRKSITSKTYDYFSGDFNKTRHLIDRPNRIQSTIENGSFARDSQLANEKYFVSDLNDVADIEYIKEYDPATNTFGRRRHLFSNLETSLFAQSEAYKVRISVPGDSSRHAGDVIEIFMPENSQQKDALSQYDKYLSGRFLVVSVRHLLQVNKEYVTIMECVKDTLEEVVQSSVVDNIGT
jgi:hypothetical protein